MKVVIEKVPEGVRVQLHYETSKRPAEFIVRPGQGEMLADLIRTAQSASSFRIEMTLGK